MNTSAGPVLAARPVPSSAVPRFRSAALPPARAYVAFAAICLLATAPARSQDAAGTQDSPRQWLQRMNEALTTRNYDGTFFHLREGGRVETLRIIHRVQDGEVRERLVSLDGSGREFVRAGNELTCYLPDQQTVLVERRSQEGPLLGNLPRFDDSTASLYDVRSAERLRFNGRDARLVSVTPRDDFRYGYRLWIDERTAMPLKTQLCDAQGRVVEQIVFSSLALSSRIPDSAFEPFVAAANFRWLRQEPRSVAEGAAPVLWSALRLPPGFRMTSQSQQNMPGAQAPVSHLVFSDGVASVSVFVERPRTAASGEVVDPGARSPSESNVGSSAAFSTMVEGHQVTAVGEVPARTVRFIAGQLRPASTVTPMALPVGSGKGLAARERAGADNAPASTAPAFAPRNPPRR